jgi:hypothetical protein
MASAIPLTRRVMPLVPGVLVGGRVKCRMESCDHPSIWFIEAGVRIERENSRVCVEIGGGGVEGLRHKKQESSPSRTNRAGNCDFEAPVLELR